jgi:hypothetical protein
MIAISLNDFWAAFEPIKSVVPVATNVIFVAPE